MVLACCQVPKISVFHNVALICLATIDSLATWREPLGQPGVYKTWPVSPPSLQSHQTQSDITLSLNSALIYCWLDPSKVSLRISLFLTWCKRAKIVNCIVSEGGCGVDSHWQQIRKPPTYIKRFTLLNWVKFDKAKLIVNDNNDSVQVLVKILWQPHFAF